MGHKANSPSAAFLSKLRRLVKEGFKRRVPAKSDANPETGKRGDSVNAPIEMIESPDSASASSSENTVKRSFEGSHASETDCEALPPTDGDTDGDTDAHSTNSDFSFVPETPIHTPVNESPAKLKPKIVIPRVPNTPMTPRAYPLMFEKVDSETETDSDDDTPLFFSANRPNAAMQRATSATTLGTQRTYLNASTNFESKSATLKPSALKYRNVSAPNSAETELKKKISRPVSFAPSTQFHEQKYPRYRAPRQIPNNADRKPSSVAFRQPDKGYKSLDRSLTPIQNVSSTLRREHIQHTYYEENMSPKALISFSSEEVETSQALRTAAAASKMLRARARESELLKARGELQQS